MFMIYKSMKPYVEVIEIDITDIVNQKNFKCLPPYYTYVLAKKYSNRIALTESGYSTN